MQRSTQGNTRRAGFKMAHGASMVSSGCSNTVETPGGGSVTAFAVRSETGEAAGSGRLIGSQIFAGVSTASSARASAAQLAAQPSQPDGLAEPSLANLST